MILYRPIGAKELELIKQSGFIKFPPRLSWQPIFYPVLDYDYACSIAENWNTNDDENGNVGYVTKFEVKDEFVKLYKVQSVGATNHNELWVPAEELEEFNNNIIGKIEIIKTFYGKGFNGIKEN